MDFLTGCLTSTELKRHKLLKKYMKNKTYQRLWCAYLQLAKCIPLANTLAKCIPLANTTYPLLER